MTTDTLQSLDNNVRINVMTDNPLQGKWELACPQLLQDVEIRPPHIWHNWASISDAAIQSPVRYPLHHRFFLCIGKIIPGIIG